MIFVDLTIDTLFMSGNIKGKITRKDYFLFHFFALIWVFVFGLIFTIINLAFRAPGVYAGLIPIFAYIIISHISASARRLNDVGSKRWIQFIPLYNIYKYLKPSSDKNSKSTIPNYASC